MISAPYTYFKQLIQDAQLGANVRLLVESEKLDEQPFSIRRFYDGKPFLIRRFSDGKVLASGDNLDEAVANAVEALKKLSRKKSEPFFRPASLDSSQQPE